MCKSVVFPSPDLPQIAIVSPAFASREMSERTERGSGEKKLLERCFADKIILTSKR